MVNYPNFYDSLSLSWECYVATSPGPLLLSWKIPRLESQSCQLLAADPTLGDFTFWATVASFVERRRLLKRWLWPQWFPVWHMMGLGWRCHHYCLALQEAGCPSSGSPAPASVTLGSRPCPALLCRLGIFVHLWSNDRSPGCMGLIGRISGLCLSIKCLPRRRHLINK